MASAQHDNKISCEEGRKVGKHEQTLFEDLLQGNKYTARKKKEKIEKLNRKVPKERKKLELI